MTDTLQGSTFFLESLAAAAKEVVAQIAGCSVEVGTAAVDASVPVFEVAFACEGSLTGGFSLLYSNAGVAMAAALLMGEEPQENTVPGDDDREAASELSRQICGSLATTLRTRFGSLEVRCENAPVSTPANGAAAAQFEVCAGNRTFSFQLAWTEQLRQALQQKEARIDDERSRSDNSHDNALARNDDRSTSQPAILQDSNLGLLLDLELPVTLRFGCREMLLKEVMELTSGSVVELDRRVREPVDLLIDNKLIARGEVVLVEGNYGLRVLEVANERERIACLP